MNIVPVTGCPLGISGKIFENTGASRRATTFTMPPFSPIFSIPIHSDSTPVKPNEISKAVFAVANVESIIAGKISVSPMNSSRTRAMANAIRKNAIQI